MGKVINSQNFKEDRRKELFNGLKELKKDNYLEDGNIHHNTIFDNPKIRKVLIERYNITQGNSR